MAPLIAKSRMEETNIQASKQEGHLQVQAKSKFAKRLASPDKDIREKAMSLLCLWLTSQKEVKEDELQKIWNGLFYCLKNAEKATVQADLIDRMAFLMEKLDEDLSLLFFQSFLTALRREWRIMEGLQVDKFKMLLKQYILRMFGVMKNRGWYQLLVKKFMEALLERLFLVEDAAGASEIKLHIADIYLNELKQFLPLQLETIELLLWPFWMVLAQGHENDFTDRVKDKVFLSLFDLGCRMINAKQNKEDFGKEDEYLGSLACILPVACTAEKLAALPSTVDANRVRLVEIHEKFMALERLSLESGVSNLSSNAKEGTEIWSLGLDLVTGNCTVDDVCNWSGDDMELDSNDGSASPQQITSSKSFGRCSTKHQKLGLSLEFNVAERAFVNDENMPPESGLAEPLAKEHLTACLHQVVGLDDWTTTDKMSSGELKQKHMKDRVFGEVMPVDRNNMGVLSVTSSTSDDEKAGETQRPAGVNGAILSYEDGKTRDLTNEGCLSLDDSIISNLAKRFDSIAEACDGLGGSEAPKSAQALAASPVNSTSKKRKSWRSSPARLNDCDSPFSVKVNTLLSPGCASVDSLSAKAAKKVRFSLKHNLVWRPSTPLPPHSLRVPPGATPRGSALKKGVPPGPILVVSELLSVSPKRKKSSSRRTPPSASRTPKSLKSPKVSRKSRLSPR